MKKAFLLLPLILSCKIGFSQSGDEKQFTRQKKEIQGQLDDKLKNMKDIQSGEFITIGDVNKLLVLERDTHELCWKIRAMDYNLRKIKASNK